MTTLIQDRLAQAAPYSAPLVSVVMPCLDEERTVGKCVRAALNALARMDLPGEVLVSDNGSTDNSAVVAEQAGARVVHCPERGYGNAVRFGVERARGEWIVMADSDGNFDLSTIERIVQPLKNGADMVVGNRFQGGIQPGAMPWKNRYIGNPILTGLLRLFFHTKIGDSQCGLRAFSRQAFERMQLECSGMEFASEMVVKAAKCRMRVVEVPTPMYPDGRNRPPHLLPWRDGWRHLKFLLMFSPLHLFLIPGAMLAVLGVILLALPSSAIFPAASLRFDILFMVLGALSLVVGVQVVQFGVVARLYTVTHRFPEPDPALDWLRKRFRFEHGLLLGGALLAIGFGTNLWALWKWLETPSGAFESVRPAAIATALMAVGVQTVFFSILAGIVNPPAKQFASQVQDHRASTLANEASSRSDPPQPRSQG